MSQGVSSTIAAPEHPDDVRRAGRTLAHNSLRELGFYSLGWFGHTPPILLLAWDHADHRSLVTWAVVSSLLGWFNAVTALVAYRRSTPDRLSRLRWVVTVTLALTGMTLGSLPVILDSMGDASVGYLAEAWVVAASSSLILFINPPPIQFVAMLVPTFWLNAAFIAAGATSLPMGMAAMALVYWACLVLGQWRQHHQILRALVGELTSNRLAAEISEINEQLHYRATHDPLTGLAARDAFLDVAQACLNDANDKGYHTALLIIDVDRFKNVNDSLGHAVGDLLLVEVAARLRSCLREGDIAARHGGDEFTVLLARVLDEAEACLVADRIRRALGEELHLEGHRLRSTVSIGLALNADPDDRAADLLRHADAALYRVKDAGRDGVEIFDQGLRDTLLKRVSDESELRDALAAGQIVAWFQPIVDMRTGAVAGAEALARWVHPEHGVLLPGRFLPLLEDAGLLPALSREMASQVFSFRRDIEPLVPNDFRITINIGVRDQSVATIVERLTAQAQQASVSPGGIALEITENAVIGDISGAATAVREAREAGFTVMLDDFGTGFSSLALLRDLPLDAIKIDRSFVRRMGDSTPDAAIVAGVLDLARRLQLYVVAEGVAEPEDVQRLIADGAVYAQGFHYSPAVPAGEFVAMLEGRLPWETKGRRTPAVTPAGREKILPAPRRP